MEFIAYFETWTDGKKITKIIHADSIEDATIWADEWAELQGVEFVAIDEVEN